MDFSGLVASKNSMFCSILKKSQFRYPRLVKKSFLISVLPKLQKSNTEKKQYASFLPSVNWILS